MASGSYEHLILISDNSEITIAKLVAKLETINWGTREVEIKTYIDSINVIIDDWCLAIGLNQAEHVIEESKEIANEFAQKHQLYQEISTCKKRFEISGEPDFDMIYFNDFCFVLEKIESFKGVYTFDKHEGFVNI